MADLGQWSESYDHCALASESSQHDGLKEGRTQVYAVSRLGRGEEVELTLDTDVDVVLRLLCFSCIFIGFGEGVCVT